MVVKRERERRAGRERSIQTDSRSRRPLSAGLAFTVSGNTSVNLGGAIACDGLIEAGKQLVTPR